MDEGFSCGESGYEGEIGRRIPAGRHTKKAWLEDMYKNDRYNLVILGRKAN